MPRIAEHLQAARCDAVATGKESLRQKQWSVPPSRLWGSSSFVAGRAVGFKTREAIGKLDPWNLPLGPDVVRRRDCLRVIKAAERYVDAVG